METLGKPTAREPATTPPQYANRHFSYCNSIVQALYHSEHFRENVMNYPPPAPWDNPDEPKSKLSVTVRPPPQPNGTVTGPSKPGQTGRTSLSGGQLAPSLGPLRPEDRPDSPEYKKKQAMLKGPVLDLTQECSDPYGMKECTFTGLKDIFTALIESQSRTGVLSPQRFLDIFKRDNEMFRNSMHQDAHEFYGIVLNDVIANVEENAKRMQEIAESKGIKLNPEGESGSRAPGTGWVHDIFEGVLTSETRCLTCETASQRDETFLDLSIDLEEHSSVTSCLQKFSAEEMLCERNKFFCDHCGGLQEAEKRMKVKKLPKILALHLKRFKYTEDYSRLQKLFHRVVYPYHLRLFNTTDDAQDPDRLYELYAVVVHIGGNAYHGHYVVVIKTKDRGWLLFDDEMVEPVDKHFVRNFFGDKPGMACAYVLFYQETTFEKVREELDAEGLDVDQIKPAAKVPNLAATAEVNGEPESNEAPLTRIKTQPLPPLAEDVLSPLPNGKAIKGGGGDSPVDSIPHSLSRSRSQPVLVSWSGSSDVPHEPDKSEPVIASYKSEKERKKELKAQEKAQKAQEKAQKAAEKEQARLAAKERQGNLRKAQEAAKECEDLQKAIEESKRMAAEEEKRHKREGSEIASSDGGDSHQHQQQQQQQQQQQRRHHSQSFLSRASRTGKAMTRKSIATFINKAFLPEYPDMAHTDHHNHKVVVPEHPSDVASSSKASDRTVAATDVTGAGTATPAESEISHPTTITSMTTASTMPLHHQNGTAAAAAATTILANGDVTKPGTAAGCNLEALSSYPSRTDTAVSSGAGAPPPSSHHSHHSASDHHNYHHYHRFFHRHDKDKDKDHKDKEKDKEKEKTPLKERFHFGLGKKKSGVLGAGSNTSLS